MRAGKGSARQGEGTMEIGGTSGGGFPGIECGVQAHNPASGRAHDERCALVPLLYAVELLDAPAVAAWSPAARLLARYLDLFREPGALPTPELRQLAAAHLRDLLLLAHGTPGVAAGGPRKAHVAAARLRAIKRAIDAGAENDLSVGTVAAGQRVSARYLQKLFKQDGTTFTQFVVDCRLERARQMLSDARLNYHTITAIAFASGFQDLSYFNRTFRRRFRCTPSEFRAATNAADMLSCARTA